MWCPFTGVHIDLYSPDLGDNSNLAVDSILTQPNLYDHDMTTCIYLKESMTFAFNLRNNPDCEGVCRSNYLLLYGQNLTQKGDEYTDFKVTSTRVHRLQGEIQG